MSTTPAANSAAADEKPTEGVTQGRRDAMPMPVLVFLFAIAYVALRLPWLFSVPLNEAPDEANHLWVVKFLVEHMRLPGMADIQSAGSSAEYGPLPPFGYVFNVFTAAFSHDDGLRLASRFGTLIAGFPTVLFAFALGRELFASRFLALMLPITVLVHPQLIFTQSYTNNDGVAISLCSACIYLAVLCIKRGAKASQVVALGFLIGWAALAKTNSLSLIPALLFALLASSFLHGKGVLGFIKSSIIMMSTLALTSGWYYIRNYFEYSGDCLGSRTMIAMWVKILPHDAAGKPVFPWPGLKTIGWWRYVFFDFWGLFGFMNRYLWRPIYLMFIGLDLVAVAGWVVSAFKRGCHENPEDSTAGGAASGGTNVALFSSHAVAIWQFLAACAVLNLAAVVYVTLSGVSGPHGRYLFTSELPILALTLAGFERLGDRAARVLTIALAILCLVSTAYGYFTYYAGKSWL